MSPSSGWSGMQGQKGDHHVAIVQGIGGSPKGWDGERMVKWVTKSSHRHHGAPKITEFANTLGGQITPRSIRQAAVQLLERMQMEMEQSKDPLLGLIGYDIGGLVIKQAALLAVSTETYLSMAKKISCLVFIGTPHRATKFESWESITKKLVRRRKNQSDCPTYTDPERLAKTLMKLSRSFQAMARIYPIVSLYECINEEALRLTPLAFCKDTSTMGVPGEVCDCLQESENRGKYVKFLTPIPPQEPERKAQYLSCLMELSKAGSHHSLGEDVHLSACTPEKSNWILDRDACKNWIGPACRPLWLYEMAKSDVAASMSVLERKARATFPDANIIKYSFDAHDDRCRSTYRMLASLSHQLLTLQPGLFDHVRFLSLAMSEEVVLKIEHLWALLRSLLSCPPENHGTIFCFVNMIDECDPSSNKFLNDLLILADSGTSAGGFRLAITSHKAPDSDGKFAAHAINVIKERQEDPDEKKKEIESAIVRETRSLFEARPELKKFDSIINEKLRAVNDVFNISLLAKLLQEDLQKGLQELMPSEMETHLSALPLTTFEIYRCFMAYIPVHRQRWARDVLAWMIHAFRPLKVAELDLAVAIQDDALSIAGMQRRLPQFVEAELKHVFGNLIQIQHGNVMFIDSSFRDFLIQDQPSSQEGNVMSDKHAKYARLCLRYLSLVTSQTEESKLLFDSDDVFTPPEGIEYGFLDYAVKYWSRHYNLAKHDDFPDLKGQACALLQTLRLSHPTWFKLQLERPVAERPVALFNPVHMAIRLGCNDIARTLLEKPECNAEIFHHKDGIRLIKTRETAIDALQEAGARHGVILYVAAMCGRDDVVDRILKDREQVEMGKVYTCPDGMTPLHQASSSGYHGVVRKLLNASYNANVWNKKRLTPLDLASQFGHVDVIEALLTGKEKVDDDENTDTNTHTACAAVVDKRPGLAQTSLMVAIEFQQPGAIEKLLDRGAKLEENHLALCRAVASGREDIVRLILRYYEKLPTNILHEAMATGDKDGCTPLHLAAREGYMNVVRQLIDKRIWIFRPTEPLVIKKSSSGDTPLHLAAKGGHAHVVKALIEGYWPQDWPHDHKYTIGVTNSLGQAPIHLAVLGGDASVVAQLCLEHHKQGVPLDFLDSRRQSPLHVACNHGLADMVDILVEHGAWSGDADENGDTPLLLGCAAGDLQMVKRLLTHDSSLLMTNFKGRSALHHAAAAGEPDVVQELLCASSDANDIRIYVNAKDESGSTPLHLATVAGNVQVIKTLLDEKADMTQKDGSGCDVLYLASRHGHANVLAFLIQLTQTGIGRVDRETFHFGWDVFKTAQELLSNLPQNWPVPAEAGMVTRIGSKEHWVEVLTHLVSLANQWTLSQYGIILHMAAKRGIVSVVDQVLRQGLHPNYADTEKRTTLMHAAESACSQMVERLLGVPDIDQDAQDKYGHSAILYAARYGHLKVASLLLRRCARVNAADKSTPTWTTPLHEAARLGNAEMCKLLLRAGADPDFETKKGETPLILAIKNNHQEALKALLDAGADPLAETGTTPLHEAVRAQPETFRPVLSKVLSLNKSAHAKNVHGRSPLLLAAVEGTQEAFMDLVNTEGADINEKDANGETPLCHAIRRQQAAIVATLVKRPELQWRPLFMSLKDMFQQAAECGDDEIMKLLIQKGIDSGLPFDEFVKLAMMTENLNLVEAALRLQDKPWLDKHGWSLECWKHALMKPEDKRKRKRMTGISETDLVPPFGWCKNDEANAGRVHGTRGGFHRAPIVCKRRLANAQQLCADHPIPPIGKFKFRVDILGEVQNRIFIGFARRHDIRDYGILQLEANAWCYFSDESRFPTVCRRTGRQSPISYGKGDVIDCHIDQTEGTAYFTKNGQHFGPVFTHIQGRLYPVVGVRFEEDALIETTFSWEP